MGEQMSLDAEEDLYAKIRRSNAETEKFIAEQRKLMAESEKLAAGRRTFDREPFAAFVGAAAALMPPALP